MQIPFNVYSREAIHFFQQNIFRPLTDSHKKILLITSAAFGFLAAYYFIKCCCFKVTSLKKTPDSARIVDPKSNNIDEIFQNNYNQYQQRAHQTREQLNQLNAQQLRFEQEKVEQFKVQVEKLIDQIRENESSHLDQKSPLILKLEQRIANLEKEISKETNPDTLKQLKSNLESASKTKATLISNLTLAQQQLKETCRANLFDSLQQMIKLHLTLGTSKDSIFKTLQHYFEEYPEIKDMANDL